MELKIWDHILPELTKRSYRLMREADQEADKAIKLHDEAAEHMIAFVNGSGEEIRKLFEEFCHSMGGKPFFRGGTRLCAGHKGLCLPASRPWRFMSAARPAFGLVLSFSQTRQSQRKGGKPYER